MVNDYFLAVSHWLYPPESWYNHQGFTCQTNHIRILEVMASPESGPAAYMGPQVCLVALSSRHLCIYIYGFDN